MKKRIALIIGLILIVGIAYTHFGLARNYLPSGKIEFSQKLNRSAPLAAGSDNQLTEHPAPDVAYAIVVMPKSYLPFLKQFAQSRMARDLKILPAKLGWSDGQPVVTPRQGNLKVRGSRLPPAVGEVSSAAPGHGTRHSSEKRILKNAALLALLQAALSGKVNYRPERSYSSVSSSLHR